MVNESDYGIAIGIQFYKGMSPLDGPHKDLTDFLTWLTLPAGGGVPDDNIGKFISSPSYTPTQDDIDGWIDSILTKFQNDGTRGRRLYFYFSGHGIGVNSSNAAMLLPRWTYSMRNYALSSEKYLQGLVDKGLFQEIFFFMDCCRNRIAGVQGQPPLWAAALPSSNGCESLLYYASEFDNPAYELSMATGNGQLDNQLTRGLFTQVLLDGLYGAAANRDGKLLVKDLVRYMKLKLPELAASKGKTQIPFPKIEIDLDKEIAGPFEKTIDVAIRFNTPGLPMVLEDPDLKPVKTGNSSDGIWQLNLVRGLHTLRKAEEADGLKIIVDGLKKDFIYA